MNHNTTRKLNEQSVYFSCNFYSWKRPYLAGGTPSPFFRQGNRLEWGGETWGKWRVINLPKLTDLLAQTDRPAEPLNWCQPNPHNHGLPAPTHASSLLPTCNEDSGVTPRLCTGAACNSLTAGTLPAERRIKESLSPQSSRFHWELITCLLEGKDWLSYSFLYPPAPSALPDTQSALNW